METQDEEVKISKENFIIRISWASNTTFIGSLRSILSLLIIIKGSWVAKTELFDGDKIESTHYQDLVIETSKFGLIAKKMQNARLNWQVVGEQEHSERIRVLKSVIQSSLRMIKFPFGLMWKCMFADKTSLSRCEMNLRPN